MTHLFSISTSVLTGAKETDTHSILSSPDGSLPMSCPLALEARKFLSQSSGSVHVCSMWCSRSIEPRATQSTNLEILC